MPSTREEEMELIRTLAEMLAQELAVVDDEDLITIEDRIDALARARQTMESGGIQCPEIVEGMIEIFHRRVRR